jgi:hypothetical protein
MYVNKREVELVDWLLMGWDGMSGQEPLTCISSFISFYVISPVVVIVGARDVGKGMWEIDR